MCPKCSDLLDIFRQSVSAYSNAAHDPSVFIGDDPRVMYRRIEELHLACEDAYRKLMEHLQADHDKITRSA